MAKKDAVAAGGSTIVRATNSDGIKVGVKASARDKKAGHVKMCIVGTGEYSSSLPSSI